MKAMPERWQLRFERSAAASGKPVSVILSEMDEPIGRAVGNAIEVAESIEIMRGGGPADTRELTVALGGEMLLLAKTHTDPESARARIEKALDDGSALAVFRRLVEAQGGDAATIDDPSKLPAAANQHVLTASNAER